MSLERITSLQNPRIKNLVKLREANHRKRQNRFIIEGRRELNRAFQQGFLIESVYYCDDFFRDDADLEFLNKIGESNLEIFSLNYTAFKKAAYRDSPDGWMGIGEMKLNALSSLKDVEKPFLIILEGIEKPGNLGAIIRTANAAGIDAIILSEPNLEVFNPNTIRASQGAFFDIPLIQTDNVELIDFLETENIRVLLTTPNAKTLLWDADLTGNIAMVMGAEDKGLSEDWLNSGFTQIKLPMLGITDSLNVSVATGICLFEAVRQRR